MLIVIANNKGGQGKTLIATLITKYLLANPKNKGNIVCCDLDKTQQNFKDNIADTDARISDTLKDIPATAIGIVDTPPSLDESTIQAIRSADKLIVPVILGKHSVQGVARVAEIRGDKKDLRILINEWDSSSVQKEAEEYIKNAGFHIIGKLPKYKRLAYNVDAGLDWFSGFSETQVKTVINNLNKLLKK